MFPELCQVLFTNVSTLIRWEGQTCVPARAKGEQPGKHLSHDGRFIIFYSAFEVAQFFYSNTLVNFGFLVVSDTLSHQHWQSWSFIETFTRMTSFDCSEQRTVWAVSAKHSKRVTISMALGLLMFSN